VVRLNNGTLIIQTVDFFTPVVDDPYQFGQIAAANALSDIYAMGGEPLFALNIVGFPINDLPKNILTEILQGGADKADEAGIPIVGGHSVDDKEPKYGLVVTGEIHQDRIWKNSGARPGDALVLTKSLGTGIIATGIKKGVATQDSIEDAINSMSSLNKNSAQELRGYNVNAVTDVTGFGLLGHLKEMCENSDVSSKINFQDLLFLDGAKELAMSGVMPGGTKRNLKSVEKVVSFNDHLSKIEQLLSADAQTSGGLLVSMPLEDARSYVKKVNGQTAIIGQITEKKPYLIKVD
jgi:selenide,water dikinase